MNISKYPSKILLSHPISSPVPKSQSFKPKSTFPNNFINKMADSAIRELEWFDLETRLREIIYQQFEIFNKKARDDRESHSVLSTNVNTIEKRLSLVEGCLFGDTAPKNVLADLQKRLSDFEGARKRDMVHFDQEVVGFKEKFKTVHFQISGNEDMIKRTEALQEGLSKEIQKVKEISEEHQEMILAEIEKINKHFKEMNTNYLEKGLKLEEKIHITIGKLDDIGLGLSKSDRQFESIKKSLSEAFITMNMLKTNKLEFDTFEVERVKTEAKLKEFSECTQEFRSGFSLRDSFIDKFVPLQVVTFISDAMHASLDPFTKKRFAEYENIALKKLHQGTLDVSFIRTREAAIDTILQNIKHVEQRKAELLIEKVKEASPVVRPVESKPVTSKPVIVQEKYPETYMSKEEILQLFEKYSEQKLDPILRKTKSDVYEKLELVKKSITASENGCMLYTQQVLSEVEDLKAKESKDILELESRYAGLKEEAGIFDATVKEVVQVIGRTGQMIVCLVENAQIDLALSVQEEEHRGDILETSGLKTRGTEMLQKKCMSFVSGHSLMPHRQVQSGKVSPLLYRSKKFNRAELVEMKGKMLKMCWDSVSKQIPWKQDEFEYIISEAVKSLKLVSSEESQQETMTGAFKEPLPHLVSPSARTRTPHTRKLKILA